MDTDKYNAQCLLYSIITYTIILTDVIEKNPIAWFKISVTNLALFSIKPLQKYTKIIKVMKFCFDNRSKNVPVDGKQFIKTTNFMT